MKILSIILMLLALVLLVPGVSQPILTLTGTVDKSALVEVGMETLTEDPNVPGIMINLSRQLVSQLDLSGEIPAYSKTRSIVGTIEELYRAEQWLVAFLIGLFSIVVPVLKSCLMIVSSLLQQKYTVYSEAIINLISKWSMADVFVVAIILAFLAANATQQTEELFSFDAQFGNGFYYFLGYCLISILSMQIGQRRPDRSEGRVGREAINCE